jgi:prepilin-type processing-associated H-X9-DG protein
VAVYLCPSDRRPAKTVNGMGAADYGGIYGQRITGNDDPPNGCLHYDHPVGIQGITDGTAHTMIVAEDVHSEDAQWINALNVFDVSCAINAAPPGENDIVSYHPHGANTLFADGAVHFLREDLDTDLLAALVTRNGSEILTGFDF